MLKAAPVPALRIRDAVTPMAPLPSIPGFIPSKTAPPVVAVPPPPPAETATKDMSAGSSSLWKTLLLPPLLALALYLLLSYILLPLLRRYRSAHPRTNLLSPLTNRLPSAYSWLPSARRRDSTASGDSLLGDEELEETSPDIVQGRREREGPDGEERRLSVELERGFRDESDESEREERGSGTVGRR